MHTQIGEALLWQGAIIEAALTEFEKEPMEPVRLSGLVIAHHAMGNALKSRRSAFRSGREARGLAIFDRVCLRLPWRK